MSADDEPTSTTTFPVDDYAPETYDLPADDDPTATTGDFPADDEPTATLALPAQDVAAVRVALGK